MSKKKHSGENAAGVTVQMRFVPLKMCEDDELKIATISIRIDNNKKRHQTT